MIYITDPDAVVGSGGPGLLLRHKLEAVLSVDRHEGRGGEVSRTPGHIDGTQHPPCGTYNISAGLMWACIVYWAFLAFLCIVSRVIVGRVEQVVSQPPSQFCIWSH